MATIHDAPVIEIIEVDSPDEEGVVVPNDVRINGQSLLCADEPVIVSEISTESRDVVRVTVTFLARRVYIGPAKRED